ncbi:hypothetical protein ACNSOO_04770 [Aliarcobacter lanthieri]|uniref:hypothetical protein n=1 Tax=Aliarcobacter lanthieri TaxID=1355374 RepID=UPI003AAD15A8
MKIIVLNLALLVFSLTFIGCSATKEPPVVFKDRPICIELTKFEKNLPVEIQVSFYDLTLANARADELHELIDLYEFQIDRYNELCEKYQMLNTKQLQKDF